MTGRRPWGAVEDIEVFLRLRLSAEVFLNIFLIYINMSSVKDLLE